MSDGQAGALRHKLQRHGMGLTIHYELTTITGDEAQARKLVEQLRQAALDLPFKHVGEIVEFRGNQCDVKCEHRELDEVALANTTYTITIYKSQGAEFPVMVAPADEIDSGSGWRRWYGRTGRSGGAQGCRRGRSCRAVSICFKQPLRARNCRLS